MIDDAFDCYVFVDFERVDEKGQRWEWCHQVRERDAEATIRAVEQSTPGTTGKVRRRG